VSCCCCCCVWVCGWEGGGWGGDNLKDEGGLLYSMRGMMHCMVIQTYQISYLTTTAP